MGDDATPHNGIEGEFRVEVPVALLATNERLENIWVPLDECASVLFCDPIYDMNSVTEIKAQIVSFSQKCTQFLKSTHSVLTSTNLHKSENIPLIQN